MVYMEFNNIAVVLTDRLKAVSVAQCSEYVLAVPCCVALVCGSACSAMLSSDIAHALGLSEGQKVDTKTSLLFNCPRRFRT